MNQKYILCCFLAFTLNAVAVPPHQSAGGETLIHEIIIDAPLGAVWDAFTKKEFITQWMVPLAEVDFRVGGTIRTNYKPNGVIGDENTIEQTVLAYEYQRMLALKVTKCPANFPFADEVKHMWSVIYFDPITPERTSLRIVGIGYGTGGNWDRMRAFFKQGNEWELQQLKKYLANRKDSKKLPSGSQLDPHLTPLLRFLGGQWEVHGTWSNGEILHARTVYKIAMGGKFIRAKTFVLRNDGTEYQRYESLYRWNASDEKLYFTRYAFDGSITRGKITPGDPDTVSFAWKNDLSMNSDNMGQTLEFLSDDETHWIVWQQTDEGKQQLIDAKWTRTSIAPLQLESIMEYLDQS